MRYGINFENEAWYLFGYDADTGEYLDRWGPFPTYKLLIQFRKEIASHD